MKTALKTIPALLFGLGLLGTASLGAQSLPEGYRSQMLPLPTNANNLLSIAPGLTVWFDGQDLMLESQGQLVSLLHFGTPVFGSFAIPIGSSAILFGESSTHGIWLVPLNGTPPSQPLANLTYNYDAVLYSPQLAIVSAKTSGFGGADNDLFALDLQTGSTQLLATIPGASGPVALAGNGDLYYATSSLIFPVPPGLTEVLTLTRPVIDAALATQQVLGLPQTQLVLAGLDSASDLACDDDGDLFFVDWFNSTIGEIDDALGTSPSHKVLLDYSSVSFSGTSLQFVGSTNQGDFEPFQPGYRSLIVHESSFGSLSQLRTVSARSASLVSTVPSPVPPGPFTLHLTNGPANGFGLVAIALASDLGLQELPVAGFEQPLWWHMGLLPPMNTGFVSFDPTGMASVTLVNPGFAPALGILCQAAFLDAQSATIGATPALQLTLTP